MAADVRSIVLPKLTSTALTVGEPTPQAPVFGVIIVDNDPGYDILWDNGQTSTVPTDATGVDDLYSATAGSVALIGKMVRRTTGSVEMQGVVTSVFRRLASGNPERCVLKLTAGPAAGCWIELAVSEVELIADR